MNLREAREVAGDTQEGLAEALGVTRPAVSQWESGQLPGGPARRLIAQRYGVPLSIVDGWFERAEQAKPEAA